MSDAHPPDFRDGMIARRLSRVKSVILVMSGKGGVGKSLISATLAALTSKAGREVGLLDADIYGPSAALILGASSQPVEDKAGLVPPTSGGVKLMSVELFAPGRPFPLTGLGAKQVVKEMLALTEWGRLDYLIIDMPPATSDIMMLLTGLPKSGVSALVVTTSDRLSTAVSRRVLRLLQTGGVPVLGVLENMRRDALDSADDPRKLAEEFGANFIGQVPYDLRAASSAGSGVVETLLSTDFALALRSSVGGVIDLGRQRRRSSRQASAAKA